MAETQPVQLGPRALLDVPVVADRGEISSLGVTGVEGRQCIEHRSDAEHVGHAAVAGERQGLRQVAEHAVDGHGSRAGLYSPAISLSSVLLPAPFGATRPVRPRRP